MTPQDDWEHINEEFADWFQGQYGPYSTRLEYFFGDCEVKDETLRKDLILKWVKSAFEVGYKKGNYDNRIPKEPAQTPHQSPCGCLIIHSYTQRPDDPFICSTLFSCSSYWFLCRNQTL